MPFNIYLKPVVKGNRFSAKKIEACQPLPMPGPGLTMRDLPGPYIRMGSHQLKHGDVLIESERFRDRTVWRVSFGPIRHHHTPTARHTEFLIAVGLNRALLNGAGGLNDCLRAAHAYRAGHDLLEMEFMA